MYIVFVEEKDGGSDCSKKFVELVVFKWGYLIFWLRIEKIFGDVVRIGFKVEMNMVCVGDFEEIRLIEVEGRIGK